MEARRSVLVLALIVCFACPSRAQEQHFSIGGQITDDFTGKPLRLVNVTIFENRRGDVTDSNGFFIIEHLSPGTYNLTFSLIGYRRAARKVTVKNQNLILRVAMREQSIVFDPIEITPGTIDLSDEPSSSDLSSREILSTANLYSRDIYRSLQILPGIAHSEWSSKPHIKGGNPDETAVIIDNLEIYEPFHLDEIDGPFSVISSDLVRDMRLYTGGFSAKHPDKMSGVLRINTIDRIANDSLKASVDFMGASVVLNQRINDEWVVYTSGRRSFLYIMEKTNGTDYPAEVYDLWAKCDYRPNLENRYSFNFMLLSDGIDFRLDSAIVRREFFESTKTNYYVWFNWNRFISDNHYFLTTVGYQRLGKSSVFSFDASYTDNNRDRRVNDVFTVKQDHVWRLNERHTLEMGFEGNQFLTDYFYREFRLNPTETTDSVVVVDVMFLDANLDGYTAAVYAQDKWKLSSRLSFMTGMRLSGQSYGDGIQWAPRLALSYDITDRFNAKLAYGWYYQPDNLFRLKTYQNQYVPDDRAEKSIHYIASLSYLLPEDATASVDLYYKDYPRLNDDYTFDFFNRIEGVGIVDKPYQTRSGSSTGVDLYVKKRYATYHHVSLAYSFGSHRIVDYAGRSTSRDLERTHTITINHLMGFKNNLSFGTIWRYHTGDPFTPSTIRVLGDSSVQDSRLYFQTEKKNTGRLPSFHTLDVRLEKKWIGPELSFSVYASIINLYNRTNVRQFTWKRLVEDEKIVGFVRKPQKYFSRFFLVGVSLELDMPRIKR